MSIRGSRNQMAEMTEQEWLQHLKKEFKSMELEFNKIFDRAVDNFRRTSPNPKGSANKVFSSSILESAIQNFPKFDGSEPKLWLRKCDRAFLLHPVPQDQKVLVASSQFKKKADVWYQLFYARRAGVTWKEFSEAVLDRFWNMTQEEITDEEILTTKQEDVEEKGGKEKPTEESYVTKTECLPNEPEPEPETRSLVKEIKPPDSEMATDLVRSPEASIEATTEAENTRPRPKQPPKPTPNPNPNTKTAQSGHQKLLSDGMKHSNTFQTLTIPNQEYTEPIPIKRLTPTEAQRDHTHSLHVLTFTTVNNRGSVQTSEFWPQLTKPPLHTFPKPRFMNSNRPNPWPNKLPIHITFDRPKPWPDDYPLNTVPKPRISSTTKAASQKLKQAKEGKPYQYQLQVRTKSVGQLRAFQVVDRNWDQFQHWNLPTTSHATTAVDFKLLLTVHINSWIVATLLTPFPDVDWLRSRPESQLMVLPVFDPGDFRSKEEEGKISFDCNGDLGHFGRILDEIQRRAKVSGRRLGERRRIGIVLEENRQRIKEEVAGLVKKKKLWFVEGRFGVVKEEEEFGCRLPEEEEVRDLGNFGEAAVTRRERKHGL